MRWEITSGPLTPNPKPELEPEPNLDLNRNLNPNRNPNPNLDPRYVALGHTSVALGSCVYNSQCVFTYLFSIPILNESVRGTKIAGVTLALFGVGLVSLASFYSKNSGANGADFSTSEQIAANIFALASAVLYALFEVSLSATQILKLLTRPFFSSQVLFSKYAVCGDSSGVVNTATGIMGIFSILLGWFGLVIVNYVPAGNVGDWFAEPFEVPNEREALLLGVNALLALVFNAFFALALAFTSPVIVSCAGMVAIPACALADWVIHGDSFGLLELVGFLCIVGGFSLLTIYGIGEADSDEEEKQDVRYENLDAPSGQAYADPREEKLLQNP